MRAFLLLAAALGAAPAFAAQAPKEPARPRANLSSYIDAGDYPAAAVRAGEQGTVRFRLDIGADGRVSGCTITQSSGSSRLDSTTCRILRSRARFTPATDASGDRVPDTVTSWIRWSLPDDAAPPAGEGAAAPNNAARARANLASYVSNDDYPADAIRAGEQGTVRFTLTVGTDGRVSACTIFQSSGSSSLDSTTCRILTERARFTPATDASGKPVPDQVVSTIRWVLPDDRPAPSSPEVDAAMKVWAQCLEPLVIQQIAAGNRESQAIADKVFPGCLAEEQKVAAALAAVPTDPNSSVPRETTQDLRRSFVRLLDEIKSRARE
jgi:TonB family protein